MNAALFVFMLYTLAVFALAYFSNQLLKSKGFLSEYFLGSRSLGVWAFALTFAATSASGGSFTGFPSLIYTYGWVLGLWIASYMVVPICTMGWLGKRLNQVARISGSITIPDVLRDRFHSRSLGLVAVLIILFFMVFNLVAQFKAGSVILKTLLEGVDIFHDAGQVMSRLAESVPFLETSQGGEYLLCLILFGVAVIFYTTYGGFHAVVWTDVMQGIVMVVGVLIMLPLAISQVGGLSKATQDMAQMIPPRTGYIQVELEAPSGENLVLNNKNWFIAPIEGGTAEQPLFDVFRLKERIEIESGKTTGTASRNEDEKQAPTEITVLKIMSPHEVSRVLENASGGEDPDFFKIQMTEFTPTDFQTTNPETGEKEDFYPVDKDGVPLKGMYVSAPGASPKSNVGFLPASIAISFFVFWAWSGAGQPSNMVRLMAFNSSATLKKSITTVAIYFSLIYFPLVIIFCCARVLMPGMEAESDRIMPAMSVTLTKNAGIHWLAGILVAAPFAAVMSTIDSFLLMMSSAIVRDIYQRNINPDASDKTVKWLSYASTLIIGLAAMYFAIDPPQFLQDIIVYTGSGLSACFLAPVVYAIYWPKCNKQGILAGMMCGLVAHLSCYVAGIYLNGSFFDPYLVFEFDPVVTGLVASFLGGLIVGNLFPPPEEAIIKKYFAKNES
ncbi:MAG: hypothetical protein KDA65_14830 [Planctomycetaceae bacterium]|nr:hypothetical protein [Planctomycetaceae bacterium]